MGPEFKAGIDEHVEFVWVSPLGGPIRLALHIRQFLKVQDTQRLNVDKSVVLALVATRVYKHGLRSLNFLLRHFEAHYRAGTRITSAHLPSQLEMELHFHIDEFLSLLNAKQSD